MVAVIYTTIDDLQYARKMAHTLIEEQLVACVNIVPDVESVYSWKGEIQNEKEIVLICKTTDGNVKKTIQRIKKLHSYEVPDIIVLPIIGGLKDYLDYIEKQTT